VYTARSWGENRGPGEFMQACRRRYLAIAGLAGLMLAGVACSGGAPASSSAPSAGASLSTGQRALNRGSGTPRRGGTLTMLGIKDVDFMDYNLTYYSAGVLGLRMWVRGLYSYPAVPGKTTTPAPDLATAAPVVTRNGLTYTVTIRGGALWSTSPPRQVTAADALLGLKRACNPVEPFGGVTDFETLIQGYAAFCRGFAEVKHTVAAIKSYINSHPISGVTASGQTITYTLAHPASSFAAMLTMPPFNPAPAESLDYLPASFAAGQHTIADGPYEVQTYVPDRKIVFARNPAWQAASDPIRHAYPDQINVTETDNPTEIQQILQTNSADGGMEWDAPVPPAAVPGLVSQMRHGGTNFNLAPTYSMYPYLVFNSVSPNNNGATGKVAVRQAISYGINRSHLIVVLGGPALNPPLTHILPDGINGAQHVPRDYDPYPYSPAKTMAMLAAAGYPSGLTVKLMYRAQDPTSVRMYQTLAEDLAKAGVTVKGAPEPDAVFFSKFLPDPGFAKHGGWDLALSGWGPDWYGDAAVSFFQPLLGGPLSFPPACCNYGFYNNPAVTSQINKAASQASAAAAGQMWGQIDQEVMKDAPLYPITQPTRPLYHASYVHNAVYVPAILNFDPTNVWLSAPAG
jgi:peptide/nickel transport system substrate-binding protein